MGILDENVFNKPLANIGKRVLYQLPKNPADKSTIVSLFPKIITEIKPTIFPSRYDIPAAEKDDFSILVIESASYYIPSTVDKMPPTEIQVNSAALAQSIINDYLSAIWLSNRGVRNPGVFWVPGAYTKKTILGYSDDNGVTFKQMFDKAATEQKAWFAEIMNAADELWARSNGNPRAIPEDARLAADILQVASSKPWMSNQIAANLNNCPSCGEMINLNYPVCKFCHAVIDPIKAKELDLVFAAR